MDEQDLLIDNLVSDVKEKKKKVDGKAKGDRTELGLCKLFSKQFNEEFSKALGSGARWAQVKHLPEHAKQTLIGDVCVPEGFTFVIESKGGYEDELDLNNISEGPIACLDRFIQQADQEAAYCKRRPIICWKRNRKKWFAFLRLSDLELGCPAESFAYRIYYREWVGVPLEQLFENTQRDYWFRGSK